MARDTINNRALLALDFGTYMGWAAKLADGTVVSGHCDFGPKRYEGGGMRFLRFRKQLDALHAEYGVGLCVVEEVRAHSGVIAAHVYGGFLACWSAWCEEQGIPYTSYPVGEIKKHATGNGAASKKQMVEAAQRRGHKVTSEDEADALAVLYLASETWWPLSPERAIASESVAE